jgi:hypothetical protein
MARNLICDSFDAQHATRSAQPGFRNIVAVRNDLPAGPDITSGHGQQCLACHNAMNAATNSAEPGLRAARLAALNKLRTFGGATGATALTLAELRLIFTANEKGEF